MFYTSGYGTGAALLGLTAQDGEVKAQQIYFTREMQNHHGGVVLVNGYLYGFNNSILTCLEFATGKMMWRDRSVGKGTLTYADGNLYIQSEDNVVGLAEASRRPATRRRAASAIPDQGLPSWAHPSSAAAGSTSAIRGCLRPTTSRLGRQGAEHRMVFDLAGRAAQNTGVKFRDHEHFFRRVVFAANAKARGRRKAEARVEGGMAQDDDGTEAELPALFKAGAHERGPDAIELMRRRNGHRCKAHHPQRGMAGERYRRKHDVADDDAVAGGVVGTGLLSDERDDRPRLVA